MEETFERQIKHVSKVNKAWNKGKPKHLHKPVKIKTLRRIGKKVLLEWEASQKKS